MVTNCKYSEQFVIGIFLFCCTTICLHLHTNTSTDISESIQNFRFQWQLSVSCTVSWHHTLTITTRASMIPHGKPHKEWKHYGWAEELVCWQWWRVPETNSEHATTRRMGKGLSNCSICSLAPADYPVFLTVQCPCFIRPAQVEWKYYRGFNMLNISQAVMMVSVAIMTGATATGRRRGRILVRCVVESVPRRVTGHASTSLQRGSETTVSSGTPIEWRIRKDVTIPLGSRQSQCPGQPATSRGSSRGVAWPMPLFIVSRTAPRTRTRLCFWRICTGLLRIVLLGWVDSLCRGQPF